METVAEYPPATAQQRLRLPFRSISIFEASPHGDALQDLEWPEHHPMGGSETASVRLAAVLRAMGFEVSLLTRKEQLAGHRCDVFISGRQWQVFDEGFAPGRLNYAWCQDDANNPQHAPLADPSVLSRLLSRMTGFLFLSHYQARAWIGAYKIPPGRILMTTNGIPYGRFEVDESEYARRPREVFYSSTPFRGLHLLLKAWPEIKRHVPPAKLHVFSSMKVYREDEPEQFKDLYRLAGRLPGVVYHGSVGQARLRRQITRCRALAYPCVFPETSCIAAMEAMAAGCGVVGTAVGALPETAWLNPIVPVGAGWLDQWSFEVVRLLVDDAYYGWLARQNRASARQYDWEHVAMRTLHRFKVDWLNGGCGG